jgi:hypothetical protein
VVPLKCRTWSPLNTSVGIAPAGDGGKVNFQSLTSVLSERCFGVHPFISVSVVEVPIGVNEVFDGVVTDFRECGSDLGTRWDIPGIDNKFAVPAREHSNVAAGTHEHAYVSSKGLDLHFGFGGFIAGEVYDSALLAEDITRAKQSGGHREAARGKEVSARDVPARVCGQSRSFPLALRQYSCRRETVGSGIRPSHRSEGRITVTLLLSAFA